MHRCCATKDAPLRRRVLIRLDADAVLVAPPQVALRGIDALQCGLFVPLERNFGITIAPNAVLVKHRQRELRARMPLLSRLAVQVEHRVDVLILFLDIVEDQRPAVHRVYMPLPCSLAEPRSRLRVVNLQPCQAVLIAPPKAVLCARMGLLSSSLRVFERLRLVELRTNTRLIAASHALLSQRAAGTEVGCLAPCCAGLVSICLDTPPS
jgi:hypothetical protein